MVRSFYRYLVILLRCASFRLGGVVFILPIVAYFVPSGMMSDAAKMWSLQNDILFSSVGALMLLWTTFRVWDELWKAAATLRRALSANSRNGEASSRSLTPDALLDEIADLRLHIAQQRGRRLTSEQRAALVAALEESDEPIRVNIVYNHLDAETEAYAAQFSAVLLPLRFVGQPIPVSDIPTGLAGVVIRTTGGLVPHLAQRLSSALSRASIDHRIEPLTGERAVLAASDYFELTIGEME
jgi:hypothetical protein